jgi:Phage stabilisation protein
MLVRVPFVGQSQQSRSLNANAERTVNCYVESMSDNTRATMALYGTPGTVRKLTLPTFPVRALWPEGGYLWVVAGLTVYRVKSNYDYVAIGTIASLTNAVSMASNGSQIIIVDGSGGWVANVAAATLTKITDVDFPNGVQRVAYQDGYFIVAGNGTQQFYVNQNPNNALVWNGLDFASAEGSPDKTVGVISTHRELFLFGEYTAEPWTNTGNASFPFERITGGFVEQGCTSAGTIAKADNAVLWLGSDQNGTGVVYRLNGYTPQRISTHAVEFAIHGYANVSDAFAFTYQGAGHLFYVLQFPTAKHTWVYDISTGLWHEREWRDPKTGAATRWRANCIAFFNRKHIVGDFENGKLYELDQATYTDDGETIKRIRSCQTQENNQQAVFHKSLIIDMEGGTGTSTGQGIDPVLMMRFSDDGGHSWSNTKEAKIGAIGKYGARVKFSYLGMARNRTYEISMTDPVKFCVLGAVIDADSGIS